jgi:hypothetical protein
MGLGALLTLLFVFIGWLNIYFKKISILGQLDLLGVFRRSFVGIRLPTSSSLSARSCDFSFALPVEISYCSSSVLELDETFEVLCLFKNVYYLIVLSFMGNYTSLFVVFLLFLQ